MLYLRLFYPIFFMLIPLYPLAAFAQTTDRELLITFCASENIKGYKCKKAINYPSQKNKCSVEIYSPKKDSSYKYWVGNFFKPNQEILIASYYSDCEYGATNYGGTILFIKKGRKYEILNYFPGQLFGFDCVIDRKAGSVDNLYCITVGGNGGVYESQLGRLIFNYSSVGEERINFETYLTGLDTTGFHDAYKVNCNRQISIFGFSEIKLGASINILEFDLEFADRDLIKSACSKKRGSKEIEYHLQKHEAFLNPSNNLKQTYIYDINKRKLLSKKHYIHFEKSKVSKVEKKVKSANVFIRNRRVALVIGNYNYFHVPKLKNPKNDSQAIAKTFKELGFEKVLHLQNLKKRNLEKALIKFSTLTQNADWSVIYFAGHGVEIGGNNYLIPVDAHLELDRHVRLESVSLENFIEASSGAKELSLIILDACRNNPFLKNMKQTVATRSIGRGLARVEPSAGVLIAYSAKHGMVALDGELKYSPYAAAFLKNIKEPNLDISLMFRKVRDTVLQETDNQQEPFVYGSLPGRKLSFWPTKDFE